MERFKVIEGVMKTSPYYLTDQWGKILLGKVSYINCFGKVRWMYMPLSEASNETLAKNGIGRDESIKKFLKELFLSNSTKKKIRAV